MFQSYFYSHLFLRLGLAFAFFWFGVEKFLQPDTWMGSSTPAWIMHLAGTIGMSPVNVFVLTGIFEIVIATSLASSFFEQWFAPVAVVFLLACLWVDGATVRAAYDVALIGGLSSLIVWPQRRYSYS